MIKWVSAGFEPVLAISQKPQISAFHFEDCVQSYKLSD